MTWEPHTAGERFELRRRLGEGSFGVVYEAWDRERQSRVALKALKTADAYALYNLKREFRTLADISHGNLVDLYELLSDGDQWFITMELVEGENFFYHVRGEPQRKREISADGMSTEETAAYSHSQTLQLDELDDEQTAIVGPRPDSSSDVETTPELKQTQGLPLSRDGLDRLRGALRSLAEGLVALHSAGIVHRDVKPSNVLVSESGKVTILDFGLVRERAPDAVIATRHIAGTPAYMAPEQALGQPVTEACDWFAVGIMLWEALVGFRPERGGDSVRPIPPPRLLVPEAPEDLDKLCQELLRRHPAERPTGSAILERLGPTPGVESKDAYIREIGRVPFVGRRQQLARLEEAFEHTERGAAAICLVHGSSGMGKTSLVRHYLSELEKDRPDAVILRGRCIESESVPYKAVDSLVDSLAVYLAGLPQARVEGLLPKDVLALARLFPVLRRVSAVADARRRFVEISDSRELRRRAFAALRDMLARLAEREPTVLFIDDLHWGDEDSAALLLDVLRSPDEPPLMLIATYRSEEVETSPSLQSFLEIEAQADEHDLFEIEVSEFSTEEGRELARELTAEDESGAARAEELVAEAAGNPFLLEKLVTVSGRRGGRESARKREASPDLDGVLTSMVSDLDRPTQQLLEVLAVMGRPTELSVATEAADLEQAIWPMLKRIETARLVRLRETRGGERIEIYHDRIRQAVIRSLPDDAVVEHHRRLFAALSAAGTADAEALAVHAEGGGDMANAAHYYATAGNEAARALAFGTAASHFARALELGGDDADEARRLRRSMGDALVNAGRGAEAARTFLLAAKGSDSAEALELRRRAAQHLLMSGHLDEGMETLDIVLAAQGMSMPSTPRRALLSIVANKLRLKLRGLGYKERDASEIPEAELRLIDTCWAVSSGLVMSNTIFALDFQGRGLLRALRAGEPLRVARSLVFEQVNTASAGSAAEKRTKEVGKAAAAATKRAHHPFTTGLSLLYTGTTAALNGRWRRAVDLADRAESVLREQCTGAAYELDMAHLLGMFGLSWVAEFRLLARRLTPTLRDAQERGDLFMETYLMTDIAPRVLLAEDRAPHARESALDGIGRWPFPGYHRQHQYALRSQVEIELYRSDGPAAWNLIDAEYAGLKRSLILRTQMNRIIIGDYRGRSALAASFAAADSSESDALRAVAASEVKALEREKTHWGEPLALLLQASIDMSAGNAAAARQSLASAEAGFDEADMRLHAAVARIRRGQIRGGETGERLVSEAEEWMRGEGLRRPDRWVRTLSPVAGDGEDNAGADD